MHSERHVKEGENMQKRAYDLALAGGPPSPAPWTALDPVSQPPSWCPVLGFRIQDCDLSEHSALYAALRGLIAIERWPALSCTLRFRNILLLS